MTARSISLKTGEEYTAETKKPLYRIASMSGNELTCVHHNWEISILRPGKEFEIFCTDPADEIPEAREYVCFYPAGECETLAQLDKTKFYRISW